MKKTKRIFAIFMTLTLAMSMLIASSVASFASAEAPVVTAPSGTKHTYEIYQVFTGTVSGTELKNLKYGVNSKGTAGKAVSSTDMAALKAIGEATYADDQAKIEVLTPYVNFTTDPYKQIGKGKDATATLVPGYYIIKDKDNSLEHPDTYTLYMFKVIGDDLTLAPKDGTTEAQKKVQDINDSTDESLSELQDSADHDIGDIVRYTLTFTLPANYHDYKTYAVDFFDDMSKGLTYQNDAKIYYGSSDTTGTSISFAVDSTKTSEYEGGKVYKASVANLKATAPSLTDSDVITIKYTAKLNEDAKTGTPGNPNKYQVTYSNNPNGTGTGTTPWDRNIVFTYKVVVNKLDPDRAALTGADFTLYKEVKDSATEGAQLGSAIKASLATGVKATALVDSKYYIVVGHEGTTAGSEFSFNGIDDGNYVLVETTIPSGYNAWEAVAFTVTAAHELESDNPALTSLTGGDLFSDNLGTVDLATGTLTTNIVNESGAVLPETGGIGTIIFYVLGTLLVVGCGVVLISKKRMENK